MQISLVNTDDISFVEVAGVLGATSVESLLDVLSLVPEGCAVVIDLTGLVEVERRAAMALTRRLSRQAARTNVAVVSTDVDITVEFVLADAHPGVAFVRSLDDAIGLVTGVVVHA